MTVDDKEFGALQQEVKDIKEWLQTIDGKMDVLMTAHNQRSGVSNLFCGLKDKLITGAFLLTVYGIVYAVQHPQSLISIFK